MRKGLLIALLLGTTFIATPLLASAGHHNGEEEGSAAADTPYGRPGDPAKVNRIVTITATEIDYNIHKLIFTKGETVKFVLVNKGEQEHELMIGDEATQEEHRKMMADMPGMSHEEMEAKMGIHDEDKNSVDAMPGETKALVWQFTKAGNFAFACNYPGHAEVGMEGKITVN